MIDKLASDIKNNIISRTAACVVLLKYKGDYISEDIANRFQIPAGTVSSTKTHFNKGTVSKQALYDAEKYISAYFTEDTKTEELSKPMTKIDDSNDLYTRVINHLNKVGIYSKILPLVTTKESMMLLDAIVSAIEEESNKKWIKVSSIITASLKAILEKEKIDNFTYLNQEVNMLYEMDAHIAKLEVEIENIDLKVLELFKSGNQDAMSKLYSKHKNLLAELRNRKQEAKEFRQKVEESISLAEHILSTKIPKDK